MACIDYSKPGVLQEALRFRNQIHVPIIDYIKAVHESEDGARIVFSMKKEASSFGSRVAARPVKIKLRNLVSLCPGQKAFVDFSEIPVISSSFADEVLGKLFIEMGPLAFMQKFEIVNASDTVSIRLGGQSTISEERSARFGRPRVSPFPRLPTIWPVSSWKASSPTTRPCCVALPRADRGPRLAIIRLPG